MRGADGWSPIRRPQPAEGAGRGRSPVRGAPRTGRCSNDTSPPVRPVGRRGPTAGCRPPRPLSPGRSMRISAVGVLGRVRRYASPLFCRRSSSRRTAETAPRPPALLSGSTLPGSTPRVRAPGERASCWRSCRRSRRPPRDPAAGRRAALADGRPRRRPVPDDPRRRGLPGLERCAAPPARPASMRAAVSRSGISPSAAPPSPVSCPGARPPRRRTGASAPLVVEPRAFDSPAARSPERPGRARIDGRRAGEKPRPLLASRDSRQLAAGAGERDRARYGPSGRRLRDRHRLQTSLTVRR